jgi:hypothetical protein
MLRILGFILFFFSFSLDIYPQTYRFEGNFHGFLDNREYFNDYAEHQSFFGNSIDIHGTFDHQGHSVQLGMSKIYEFGSHTDPYRPKLITNYQFSGQWVEYYFGTFKRKGLLEYPIALITDSLNYYRPLVEGTLLRINHKNNHQQLWLDWTGRQTDTIRETFLAGFSGKWHLGQWITENYVVMYHHAKPAVNVQNLSIRDNGGAALFLGYPFSPGIFCDSLVLKIGGVVAYDRDRAAYGTRLYQSGVLSAQIFWKHIYIKGNIYMGDGLDLFYGEKIYRAPNYARIDLGFEPFSHNPQLLFQISVHYVDGTISYAQLINLYMGLSTKPREL